MHLTNALMVWFGGFVNSFEDFGTEPPVLLLQRALHINSALFLASRNLRQNPELIEQSINGRGLYRE